MKNKVFSLIICLFIILQFISYAFSSTIPPERLVSEALDKTLLEMNNPILRVIKQGSWISGENFRPITSLNPSDYDSRLFITIQDISQEDAFNLFKKFRLKLQQNLLNMAKQAGYDSDTIGKIRSLTNFYPPEQIIKNFNSTEEALEFFLNKGVYPSLGEFGKEGAEGVFSKHTKFMRQGFETGKRVQVSQLVLDEGGGYKIMHKASAAIEHLTEGKAPMNIQGYIQGLEHALEESKKALKNGQYDLAEKQMKRASRYLKDVRNLVNVSTESELIEKIDSLENIFTSLKNRALKDSGIDPSDLSKIMDDIVKKLKPIESELLLEKTVLTNLRDVKNPKSRWLLKGLLENDKNFGELKGKLVTLSNDAISKGLTKEFAMWFGTTLLDFWNLKQLDDAIKKGEVTMLNLVIPGLVNYLVPPTTPFGWAMLFTEIYMVTVSLAIQYVEATGYFALIRDQDCMDLIAGIYTMKGREHRIFERRCEEIRDSKDLACRIYDHHGLRRTILKGGKMTIDLVPPLLQSILKCHSDNASIHYDEMNQSRHDERISKALVDKCTPIIIKEWFEARQIVINDIDLLRQNISEADIKLSVSPRKITKKSTAYFSAEIDNLQELERQLKENIKCISGIHGEPKFYSSYKWKLNGKEITTNYNNKTDIYFEKEGSYDVCVDIKYEWLVTGLPVVSIEEGISGSIVKNTCIPIVVSDEGDKTTCQYTYSNWSECNSQTKKQTRTVLSKSPAGCVEKQRPTLEQTCTPLEKDAPTCSYEYSDWGECVRATKKQTRTVVAKKPDGCVERQKPSLERGCTPPPTEEEKRNQYFNCLCRCSSGWASHIGVWYDPEGKTKPGCESSGPCIGGIGAFGCSRRHFFNAPNDCAKGCWESAFGKGTYDPNKADKMRREENKKYAKPLTVKLKASKNPADFGDVIDIQAQASEGTGGYTYNWSGCAQDAKDYNAKVSFKDECKPCTVYVSVTDQDGNSASDSLTMQCNAVRVKLTKETPKEATIPIGGRATFYAEVFSGDKPFTGPTLTYIWERNPDAIFGDPKNPQYEQKGGSQMRHSATFRKTGITPVWVIVQREMDGRWKTIGQSEQISIQVVNPELIIKYTPEKPMIGQEVKIEVSTNPKIGDDMVSFWWDIPNYFSGTGDKASIKPKDSKPIKVVAHAKAKDGGDDIGTKEVIITAQGYQVSISEPRYLQSPPQIWQCDTQLGQAQRCGMVTLKPNQFTVHSDIFMKATITPTVDSPRYKWSIDPAGSCGFPGAGDEIKINCSNTGTYTVKVEVTNADGVKLGEAIQSVTISISQEQINNSKKAKDAYEKLQKAKELVSQGKLDEAINLAQESASLDPKNQEAKGLLQKWTTDKQTIQQHISKVRQLIDKNDFKEAERIFQSARALNPKYPAVVETENILSVRKKQFEQQMQAQCEAKWTEGTALYNQKKHQEALIKFKENITCNPNNKERQQYVAQLEQSIRQQEAQRQACMNIRKQGDSLVQQKRLKEAIVQYREYLRCNPDRQIEDYIKQLEDIVKKEDEQRQRYEYAKKVRSEGEQYERAKRIPEAIARYKESLRYLPDPALEKHIRDLELAMARPTPTPIPTPTYTPPPVTTQKGKVIFDNGNTGGVYNNPTRATVFTINQPYVITSIQNYHWNNAKGSTPGTISLKDSSGRTYGPWQAKGLPGQGGVPNAYWTVYPNITLPAGTYTIIDSDPSTWSQNSGSHGAGHTRIEGYPSGQSSTGAGTTAPAQDSSSRVPVQTITAHVSNNGSQNVHIIVEGQDTFGPHNRLAPGERNSLSFKTNPQTGYIKFIAGRNGQKIAECRFDLGSAVVNVNMIPQVTFIEPNELRCTTGWR